MLDADYLFNVADEIVELYEQLNIFGINDICRRLVNAEFQLTGSAEWQYYILQQTGMSREEINKQIAQITKKSEAEIKAIFEEASYQSYNADMSVYEKAGLTALPFSQSERMLSILDATYRATLGELHNLTMTTADASQELLINTLNETQWKVATGMQSKSQAVAEAVEKVAADGINVLYGEGVRRSIESVVRMCVTTGINQACSQISLQNCESMGTDLVLTSSHPGARTGEGYKGHVNWQGRVFSLSGNSKKYPSFKVECGFGQALGICGINCRHSFLPYIDGVSHNPFERYDSEEDKVKYANQQKQRRMERDIRTTKRQLQAMQESMNATAETDVRDVLQEKYDKLAYKLRNQNEKYNLFCADNNLIVQPERMKVARFNRSQAQRVAWGAKRYEEVNASNVAAPNITDKQMQQAYDDFGSTLLNSKGNENLVNNMIMYQETTELVYDERLPGPFAYKSRDDVIAYNPKAPNYNLYDMNYAQSHELAHRMDFKEYHSWDNVAFQEAIAISKKKVYDNIDRIRDLVTLGSDYRYDMAFSDILSALSDGELNSLLTATHDEVYWGKPRMKSLEVFANLSSIEVNGYESKAIIKELFPELVEAYEEML